MVTHFSGLLIYNLLMYNGFGLGTKKPIAVRSGKPISHRVGPSLGGLKVKLPSFISDPGKIEHMVLEAMNDN